MLLARQIGRKTKRLLSLFFRVLIVAEVGPSLSQSSVREGIVWIGCDRLLEEIPGSQSFISVLFRQSFRIQTSGLRARRGGGRHLRRLRARNIGDSQLPAQAGAALRYQLGKTGFVSLPRNHRQ